MMISWYRVLLRDPQMRFSTLLSMALFASSIFVLQPMAVEFANTHASNAVEDIILSNIPTFNVAMYFVYGMFLLVAVITALCIYHPNRIAFTLFALSLFVIIRCIFVSLTHLGPAVDQATGEFSPGITKAFFGADLFFSGHTGAPFLMALIYWHQPLWRTVFFLWSLFFGAVVLMGHFHYSIDVLAAFFITYSIYQIALYLFPREREWFLNDR